MQDDLATVAGRRLRTRAPSQALEATVLAAPASPDQMLRIRVDAQPGRVRDVPWTPRADQTPQAGDAALVIESDAGGLWCIAWWPNP